MLVPVAQRSPRFERGGNSAGLPRRLGSVEAAPHPPKDGVGRGQSSQKCLWKTSHEATMTDKQGKVRLEVS